MSTRRKTKFNKKEKDLILSVYVKLYELSNKYKNNDIELCISGNGTVYTNLSSALSSLDIIIQDNKLFIKY